MDFKKQPKAQLSQIRIKQSEGLSPSHYSQKKGKLILKPKNIINLRKKIKKEGIQ